VHYYYCMTGGDPEEGIESVPWRTDIPFLPFFAM
jgi:hypothetical protein